MTLELGTVFGFRFVWIPNPDEVCVESTGNSISEIVPGYRTYNSIVRVARGPMLTVFARLAWMEGGCEVGGCYKSASQQQVNQVIGSVGAVPGMKESGEFGP